MSVCPLAVSGFPPKNPGTPDEDVPAGDGGDDARIIAQALSDVAHYRAAGVDALVLENSHDLPYIKPPLRRAPSR